MSPKRPRPPTFIEFATMLRVPLTPAQRALARVAFDGLEPRDLAGDERTAAALLFGDVDVIPPEARAVLVAVCGARAGKSYILISLAALWKALVCDLSTLAPGEHATAIIVAPDLRLARANIRYVKGAVRSNARLSKMLLAATADQVVLHRPDGYDVSIIALPATRGGSAVRGRSLVFAGLDEAAFFLSDDFVVNAEEIFSALAPRVLPDGIAVVASTPWVEGGLLYTLFSSNFGAPKDALAAHGPTLLMLDTPRNRAAYTREMKRDPDNAETEFGARFASGAGGLFFSSGAIDSSLVAIPPHEPPARLPRSGREPHAVLGTDIGLVADSSAAVSVYLNDDGELVVAEVLELRPEKGKPLRLSHVVHEFCEFARRHRARVMHADHHALEPAREHLAPGFDLVPIEGGQDAKTERHIVARDAVHAGRVRIPAAFVRLAAQLRVITSRKTIGGGIVIQYPRRGGRHGDVAAAFVVAASIALREQSGAIWLDEADFSYDGGSPFYDPRDLYLDRGPYSGAKGFG